MVLGLLPPSPSGTRFTVPAGSRWITWPTAVDPVKAILPTRGWRTSAAPAVAPGPGTTFRAPGGRPAAGAFPPTSRAVGGVSWAGLSTTVHPAASAGATFHVARFKGKFHGTIAPTTPTGSRSVYVKKLPFTGSVSPVSLSAQPAEERDVSIAIATSIVDSNIGLPLFLV